MTLTYLYLFLSVVIGAFIVEIFKPKKSKNIQLLLTFSGAYLLAISVIHLIPELFSSSITEHNHVKHNHTENMGIFILLGFLIQILLEYFSKGIEHGHFHKRNVIPFSILISLCLHAILEGIPLGGNLSAHNALLTGIVLHKVPVAVVLMTFFIQSGMKKYNAYILLFLFAIMAPLGAYAGNLFSSIANYQSQIMAIVIGIFLHISTTILFESTDGHKLSLQKIITVIIGSILAILSL